MIPFQKKMSVLLFCFEIKESCEIDLYIFCREPSFVDTPLVWQQQQRRLNWKTNSRRIFLGSMADYWSVRPQKGKCCMKIHVCMNKRSPVPKRQRRENKQCLDECLCVCVSPFHPFPTSSSSTDLTRLSTLKTGRYHFRRDRCINLKFVTEASLSLQSFQDVWQFFRSPPTTSIQTAGVINFTVFSIRLRYLL